MSKWFERDPDWLVQEMQQLQNSSDYAETEHQRNKLVVSAGNFLVRVNGQLRTYPAVIVYPDATPYALPRVFFLEKILATEEVIELAALEEALIPSFLEPRVRFHFQRHQNPDGSLCLLEQDNVDREGVEVFDAQTVLRRVRQWLSGLSTGRFPPESAEVELVAHYPKRDNIHILLTDDFYRPGLSSGQFYLQPLVKWGDRPPQHYIGACLMGRSASGLYLDDMDGPLRFMPDGLQSRVDLTLHPDRLHHALQNKTLEEGYWWQLAGVPSVFRSPAALVMALGDGDTERGLQQVTDALWPRIKQGEQKILLGLRFANRRGEQEWLMLALHRERQNKVPFLVEPPNLLEMLDDYDLVALFSEPFTEQAFYLRNQGRVDHFVVKEQTVSLIGCGALGSEVADCLGKAGVGQLWLNDMQAVQAHNTVRHLAGLLQLGMHKTRAVESILLEHNRFLNITCRGENVLRAPLSAYTAPVGISVSTMADDNTEGYVNEQAVTQGRTVYYARALRGGKAARIFRVRPGRDACFDCLALYKAEGNPDFPVVPEDKLLPTIRNECNNPIRPASAADLKLIAALVSRLLLDEMQSATENEINHWVWTTEPELGLGATPQLPQALLARHLPPHPSCRHCRPLPTQVHVHSEALAVMQTLTLQTPGIETGGLLVGHKQADGAILVQYASGPGPNSQRSATGFDRDVSYCQQFVDEKANEGWFYVGEWHSHPTEDNRPSQTDLTSLRLVAQQPGYLTTEPVMIILSRSAQPACTVHPAGKASYAIDLIVTSAAAL